MGLFVDTDWQYRGLQVVRIENEHIRVDVFPEVGAKIYNFVHKDSNRNLLWHNPRVPPARVAYGAIFDDHWSGGWDELVPNDMPFPARRGIIEATDPWNTLKFNPCTEYDWPYATTPAGDRLDIRTTWRSQRRPGTQAVSRQVQL